MNLRTLQELLQDEDFVSVEEIKEWLEEYLEFTGYKANTFESNKTDREHRP